MASRSYLQTARHAPGRRRRRLAAAAAACTGLIAAAAPAQEAPQPPPPPPQEQTAAPLEPVVVTGRDAEQKADVAGFGNVPLTKLPLQASVLSAAQMRERGVRRLADVVSIDAGIGDAYNTEGYWDFLTIRGFVLDNRSNFRRDGLPINAETSIALDNKERIEVLKGLSGLQAGVSAPGGLVNYVVKRPDTQLRSATLGWRQDASLGAGVDVSQRWGEGDAYGLRVNAAYEDLEPRVRNADGHRHLLAAAGDWRLSPDTTLETEFETSRRVQPSVPGFSLLGDVVPAPGDPRLSLNNQPWSLPVVFDGDTASLRWRQRLNGDWSGSVHLATQRLRTDDRVAFPSGCSAENNFDRYCSDGTFDYYDFRSEGERRRTDALDLALDGQLATGCR
jgi:iron complex outermembrane receptor protein